MTEWKNRLSNEIKLVPANQLLANPQNPRRHPVKQREALRGSLDTLGFVAPILISKQSQFMLDGHARVEEALSKDENTLIPVIEVDLEAHEESLFLASFDYITYLAEYDRASLDSLLRDVQTDDTRLQAMLSELAEDHDLYFGDATEKSAPEGDPEALLNHATELQSQWKTERGQVWVIGRHRLMCGDSYNPEHLERLLNGRQPDLLHTDPPYGISIVKPSNGASTAAIGGAKPFGSTGQSDRKGKSAVAFRNSSKGKVGGGRGDLIRHHAHTVGRGDPANIIQSNIYPVIEGDDTPFEPEFLLDLAPIVILWGANYFADKLPVSSGWIVWDKRENLTRNNFADCEMAWTNQDKPARIFYHLWNGLHKGSQHGERRIHPTEKPVALFAEIGNLLAPNGLWLDLFAGSGAQIVAAEQNEATCYALEYEPLYVALVLQRLSDMGLSPELSHATTHET